MIIQPRDVGWIEVVCGPMFSGKTEELIRRVRRAQYARQRVQVFKPAIDDRYHAESIVSHNEDSVEAHAVQDVDGIRANLDSHAHVIGIDEAQFFGPDVVEVCQELANRGCRVIVAGLDQDYMGEPFGPMPHLLCVAEYITKLLAICVRCGNPAGHSYRLASDPQQVLVGATEQYEARCRRCYWSSTETDPDE
jgi:thymidine kinase